MFLRNYFFLNTTENFALKIAGADGSKVNCKGAIIAEVIAFGNGTLVIPVNPLASSTIFVTVKTNPVGEDGMAAEFMFSFNDVADTSSHVPAFNGFNPSQLIYNELSSLNSIFTIISTLLPHIPR